MVAVVTTVTGRHQHLLRQREGLAEGTQPPDLHVLAVMGDPSVREILGAGGPPSIIIDIPTDGHRLPLAAARNSGAAAAIAADADNLVFLDVDCIPDPQLVERYVAQTVTGEPALWCGPVCYLPPPPESGYDLIDLRVGRQGHPARPVPVDNRVLRNGDHRLFWSLSFAVSVETWYALGGFCADYRGYGGEDTDFGATAQARGIPLHWVGGAWAYHQYHPTNEPPTQHLDDIIANAGIFFDRWGWWPMEGWLDEFRARGLAAPHPVTGRWQVVRPTADLPATR